MASEKGGNGLLIIAVIAVVVAVIALLVNFSNLAAWNRVMFAPGIANVTITQNANFQLLTDKIIWGNGTIPTDTHPDNQLEYLETNQSYPTNAAPDVSFPGGYWSRNSPSGDKNTTGFLVRNVGNINLSISVASELASTYIKGGGGTYAAPEFGFKFVENMTGACPDVLKRPNGWGLAWTNFNGVASYIPVCTQFNYLTNANTLEMHIHMGIPENAPTGDHYTTIDIAGVAAS